jgi:nucleoid DNA-binding protein
MGVEMKKIDGLIKIISVEQNIPYKVAYTMVYDLFKQLREEATKGKNVRIIKLGLFYDSRDK